MELKLLQKDVAKICGVCEDSITNWEMNKSVPQVQFFPRIIKFLGYLPIEVDMTTLPGRLKAYRYFNGLSQKQMGKILSVDGATICSWELEEHQPHKEMLKKLDAMLATERSLNALNLIDGE
ncbi:XRE family transcriptional regulator [Pedobacter sp. Leaf194]|nr:XRE family transcriptional regulator [Pedobacter sp. Leaf194]